MEWKEKLLGRVRGPSQSRSIRRRGGICVAHLRVGQLLGPFAEFLSCGTEGGSQQHMSWGAVNTRGTSVG